MHDRPIRRRHPHPFHALECRLQELHELRRGRTMMYGVMDVNPGRW